ncbi:MAG: hypothetical protein ACTS3F_13975 [Phycisphaerales bacterium]
MGRLLRALGSIRWPILLLLWPLLWSLARLEGSGGWVMLVAGSLLILFWGLLADVSLLERCKAPRLALRSDRHAWSLDTLIPLRTLIAGLALVAALALLGVSPLPGRWALLAWFILLLITWVEMRLDGRNRYWLAEFVVPLAAAIVPTLIVAHAVTLAARAARAEGIESGVPESEVRPTLLAHPEITQLALLTLLGFGVMILSCLIRDEGRDLAAGYRTTPTALGRLGGLTMLALWQIAAIAMAGIGVQSSAWGFAVPTILGAGAIASNWLLSARADAIAVTLWWAAATIALWVAMV